MAYTAAVDLGTTTIAVALLSEDGVRLLQDGFLNPQKKYGSDVIARITLSEAEYKRIEMTTLVREMILDSIKQMLFKIAPEASFSKDINKVVVMANTVMAALFLGYSINEMGQYPFPTPFSKSEELVLDGVPFYVPIGVSAFLGADSVAGAFASSISEREVFMDLGTNGEILVKNNGKIYASSAACGPAFENCTRPIGVSANTTLMVISELLSKRKLRRDGVFSEEFIDHGIDYPVGNQSLHLTAKIFREIQLAVSALYTTYELLLQDAGLEEAFVERIYLSGGFSFYVRLFDAMNVGLIPEKLLPKACVAGNTSLLAAEYFLLNPGSAGDYDDFCKSIITKNYGGDARYEDLFVQNLILNRR